MGRLIHYSKEPLTKLLPMSGSHGIGWGKPPGLWFSVEGPDDWPSWCEAESFKLGDLRCQTELIFKPEAKLLRLESPSDIRQFTDEYGILNSTFMMDKTIDWKLVAERYQGIIISPYQWECRLADWSFWYYGWDCASGVTWDIESIQELRPLIPSNCTPSQTDGSDVIMGTDECSP